jgi:hypothetical protein
MGLVPSSISIFNMVLFNHYIRKIEENNYLATDLKVGFGFKTLFGNTSICGFAIKDWFYYDADWRLFTVTLIQAATYVIKNFMG